jgi:D-amino-acid dehydrogenase
LFILQSIFKLAASQTISQALMKTTRDVVIIGGGAIGLCTAYYLSQHGLEVTILEKNEIGSGCSFGNAGLIVPSHIIPLAAPGVIAKGLKWMFNPESPFYLEPRFDLQFLSWLWKFSRSCNAAQVQRAVPLLHALCQNSAQLFAEIQHSKAFSFDLERRGLLMLYQTEKEWRAEQHAVELAREMGMAVENLGAGQIRELDANLSTNAGGGIYYPNDCHLDPARFVNALAQFLRNRDVQMITNTTALQLGAKDGKVTTLKTSRGDFSAETFVLASGAWSPELLRTLRLRLPVQAGKGYSITIPKPKHAPRIPLLLAEARVAVTPLGERLRFAGTMELAGNDLAINHRRVRAILNAVPKYLPHLGAIDLPRAEVWAGLRPCTPDGLPYIGAFHEYDNLIAATGHAMLGVTLAPITGKLVSDLILKQPIALDMNALHPERFD